MLASTDGVPVQSFRIFKDDKFMSRRLSRVQLTIDVHSSSALESYHAGARAAVPFLWESQPGTPKHRLRQTPLPPLTPPPSYFFKSASTTPARRQQYSTRTHPGNAMFPNLNLIRRNIHHAVRLRLSPSSSSGASTQSLSSPSSLLSFSPSVQSSSPVTPLCDYYYSRRYGFTFEVAEEAEYLRSSPSCCSPISCFRSEQCNRRSNNGRGRSSSGGHYSSIFTKLFSASTP